MYFPWRGRANGNTRDESGPDVLLSFKGERAGVLFDDGVARQSESLPGSLANFLGGEKWIENTVAHRQRNTGSVVAHGNADELAFTAG